MTFYPSLDDRHFVTPLVRSSGYGLDYEKTKEKYPLTTPYLLFDNNIAWNSHAAYKDYFSLKLR